MRSQHVLESVVRGLACSLVATGALAGGTTTASAVVDDTVTAWESRIGSWTFVAAHDEGGLRGFLAECDPQAAIGANIRMVWFPTSQGAAGTPMAWTNLDVSGAAAWLASSNAVNGTEWLNEFVEPTTVPLAPEAMESGLLASDPLVSFVQSAAEPEEVVEIISSAGLGAAPMLSAMTVAAGDGGSPGAGQSQIPSIDVVLQVLTLYAQAAFNGQEPPTLAMTWGFCSGCTKVTVTGTPSAWTCIRVPIGDHATQHCKCTRTLTRCFQYSGLDFLGCDPCPVNNCCQTQTEHGETTVLPSDPCPPIDGPGTSWFGSWSACQ